MCYLDISVIMFMGELCIGSMIMKVVVDGVKEVLFELGGKNVVVVFVDVDFDVVVVGVFWFSFMNVG